MKKKLLEKDGFYLALFVGICLVAIGGVWFTKNNVDELTSNDLFVKRLTKIAKETKMKYINRKRSRKRRLYTYFNWVKGKLRKSQRKTRK